MSTWNEITIKAPGEITRANLPDELTSDGEIWEEFTYSDSREDGDEGEGVIEIQGWSKYRAYEAAQAIEELSKKTGRVTHLEEWDDEGPGSEETVYENGEQVIAASKVSRMVPANLDDLIAEVRKHNRRNRHGDVETRLHVDSMESIMALLDALDPEGEK